MKKKNQLSIDFPKPEIIKPEKLHYLDLTIDQKINAKANSQGFANVFLKGSRICFREHIGFVSDRRDNFSMLTEKWFWHHKHNKNRPWDALKPGQLFREIKKHNQKYEK